MFAELELVLWTLCRELHIFVENKHAEVIFTIIFQLLIFVSSTILRTIMCR